MHLVNLVSRLTQDNGSKIVFVIADGLGGIPGDRAGSELETANTPHLDRLASNGITGLLEPVAPGITCGSGPSHFALFGYDPLEVDIGRGVLTALGVDFDLQPNDVAARGNFCTVDDNGIVTDRRAGRISSQRCAALAEMLQQIEIKGIEVFVKPVKEHRFLLVLRGEHLGPRVSDTDPQKTGVRPIDAVAQDPASKATADAVSTFVAQAGQHGIDAGVRSIAHACVHERALWLAGLCVGRLPHVPRYRPPAGHECAAMHSGAGQRSGCAGVCLEGLRFLLRSLQANRQRR